jgi:hypothetical protein
VAALISAATYIALCLSANPLRRAALAHIAQHYEGHAELESVSFRWQGGLTIRSLRLHEGQSAQSPVLIDLPRMDLDGSWFDLVARRFAPTRVTLERPVVRVLQDDAGSWSLELPLRQSNLTASALKVPVQVHDARIELVSRADASRAASRAIDGVTLDIQAAESSATTQLTGRVADRVWGLWDIDGTLRVADGRLRLRARSPMLLLGRDQSEWFGQTLVGAWDSIQPAGKVAAEIEVVWNRSQPGHVQYHVLVDPLNISLRIPTVPDRLTDVAGRLEITRDEIRVHGMVGRWGSGQLTASGTLRRDEQARFDLTVETRQLPLLSLASGLLGDRVATNDSLSGVLRLAGTPDPATWAGAFDGSVRLAAGGVDPIPLHLAIKDSLVYLSDLRFAWADGEIQVEARAPLGDDATVLGAVSLRGVNLAALSQLAGEGDFETAGTISGELAFAFPFGAWSNGSQWQWHGPVRLRDAKFGDVEFAAIDGRLRVDGQSLVLDEASATLDGQAFRGRIGIGLASPFPIGAQFTMAPLDLADFTRDDGSPDAAPLVRGRLGAEGELAGTLAPLAIKLGGIARATGLAVQEVSLGDTSFSYTLAGAGFDFSGAELSGFGGRLQVQGRWNWPSGESSAGVAGGASPVSSSFGQLRLDGAYQRVDLSSLLSGLFASQPSASLRGLVSGRFRIETPAITPDGTKLLAFASTIESRELWLAGTPLHDVRANLSYTGGPIAITQVTVTHPAGTLSGAGRIDTDRDGSVLTARIASTHLSLEKMVAPRAGVAAAEVRGAIAGELSIRWDVATDRLSGQGRARCAALALGDLPPIDFVETSDLRIDRDRITIARFDAAAWGGSANGSAVIDLDPGAARPIDVTLDRAQGVELAAIVKGWPAVANHFSGKVTASGRLFVPKPFSERGVSGAGAYQMAAGAVFGVPIESAQGTFELFDTARPTAATVGNQSTNTSSVATQQLQIKVQDSRAAGGLVRGQTLLTLARPVVYDCSLQFADVDLARVARLLDASSSDTAGIVSGSVHLRGTERGAIDLRGDWTNLRIRQANLWPIPVFAVIAKVLNLNLTKSGGFHTGDVARVTLRGGRLDFYEFRLAGDVVQLFGEGTVDLNGKLDLEVVGNVESGLTKDVPVVGTLQRALGYLQRRLVRIHVVGTLADPVAVPVPLQDLSEPALRFFKGVVTGTLFDDNGTKRTFRR